MVGFLIAALVIMLVVGPVMWLKPSQGEARQTRLRLLARQLGLQVRLCNLPQVHRAKVRREDADQGVVYSLPMPDPGKLRPVEFCLVRASASEPWEDENHETLPAKLRSALNEVAESVPDDVIALGLTPQGPAVYWRERGDEATVKALAEQLQTLRGAMASTLAR